jgi:hypothetical protein
MEGANGNYRYVRHIDTLNTVAPFKRSRLLVDASPNVAGAVEVECQQWGRYATVKGSSSQSGHTGVRAL